ncbi:MAG TPA: hypothetical protein VN638_00520 [Nitrospiraceae bacterium]|jgi:hypothetical protein|nr:hypothetical protein [Nitrospiraceae bacterium]
MNTDQVTLGRTSRNLHGRYRMTPSHSLTYVINFRDNSNCVRIQNAQPGKEILVLVHPEQEPLADPLGAKGMRSQDGALFIVEITKADGTSQSFEWEYPLLKLVAQLLQPLR